MDKDQDNNESNDDKKDEVDDICYRQVLGSRLVSCEMFSAVLVKPGSKKLSMYDSYFFSIRC